MVIGKLGRSCSETRWRQLQYSSRTKTSCRNENKLVCIDIISQPLESTAIWHWLHLKSVINVVLLSASYDRIRQRSEAAASSSITHLVLKGFWLTAPKSHQQVQIEHSLKIFGWDKLAVKTVSLALPMNVEQCNSTDLFAPIINSFLSAKRHGRNSRRRQQRSMVCSSGPIQSRRSPALALRLW